MEVFVFRYKCFFSGLANLVHVTGQVQHLVGEAPLVRGRIRTPFELLDSCYPFLLKEFPLLLKLFSFLRTSYKFNLLSHQK